MIKKSSILIVFLFFAYLLLPPPTDLPSLPGSVKSTEPGDTLEIPGVSAYYTNLSRQEVLAFYQKNFSRSRFLGIPLLIYRLNHPPEYAKQIFQSTKQSSFLEEIVHPLRESLFVNGFEWEVDPFTKPESRAKNKMIINQQEFKSKITLLPQESNPILRLILAGIALFFGFWLFKELKGMYGSFRRHSKF